jgi:acylphosphatase
VSDPTGGATPKNSSAVRVLVSGSVQGVGFREAARRRANELRVLGWVRNEPGGTVQVHAEGPAAAVDELLRFLHDGPPAAIVAEVACEQVAVEGHEQFAIRGVSAGRFRVYETPLRRPADGGETQRGTAPHGYELLLEVDGLPRAWELRREPSLDPAAKRLAIELAQPSDAQDAAIWDEGNYEQGGRVAWPEALRRGHAVFVLHGARLRGGFALQRTRGGPSPQWLLIKRRDEHAQRD